MYLSLQLANALDFAGVVRVSNALRAVQGVDAVDATSGSSAVEIRFDQNRTSAEELNVVLARAGHPAPAVRSAGRCCGSCGG